MVNTLLERSPRAGASAAAPSNVSTRQWAYLLGVLAFLTSFMGSWIPSFWGDEAASVMSAQRSLPSLFAMVHTVDAVHGTYYLFLHFWIDLFGSSELAVRFPSAVAVAFSAAGTFVLAERLFSRRVGAVAGVLCAVLPRFTYMGSEARSYAFSTAVAVWLTVLLAQLLMGRITSTARRLAWIGYGVGLAAGIYLFLYLALLVVVHGTLILFTARGRSLARRFAGAVGLGLTLAIPIIVAALAERHQIAFLAHRTRVTFSFVVVEQWFGNAWLAIACWAFIVLACVVGIRGTLLAKRLRAGPPELTAFPAQDVGMLLSVAWLVVPTVLVLAGNALLVPMYTNRYLSFCTPAAAILIAVGVSALPRRWMQALSVLALVAIATPIYLAQHTEFGKPGGSDWSQVSAVIGSEAKPGDAIVFDQSVKASWRPRLAMHLYPSSYKGLDDVALMTPFDQTTGLWDSVAPLSRVAPSLVGISTVWALETTASNEKLADSDLNVLMRDGFTIARTITVHRTIIYELARSAS